MIVLIGPVLFILLILFAIRQQKCGLAGWKAALLVIVGTGAIAVEFRIAHRGLPEFRIGQPTP